MFTAGTESCVGSIRLSTNGALKVIWRPPETHAGEAMTVKSPASILGVGTKDLWSVGVVRS